MNPYTDDIIPASTIAKNFDDDASLLIKTIDADFSKQFEFKKVGAHHVTLPPGRRSSLPHAESIEEEFVFVVSGYPHVWIDGYVYELTPNCAVGFPSGTGIAHCFINNTNEDVELLVFGERTKKENLCAFPLNPEQKELSGILWTDAPVRTLGPHNGRPGFVNPIEVGADWPSCIIDCSKLALSQGWHYPGDSETFGEYARLTNLVGLKVLGVGFEVLPPGKRSSFPHAHKTEEEFAFILSGQASIWMNGFIAEAHPGDGVAFVPGTNVAHTIINDSTEPLIYVVVGEATDEANEDRIFYPQHPFRNEQCRYLKALWEDRPMDKLIGSHNGRAESAIIEHLSLSHLSKHDENLILEIFKKSPDYFARVDGCKPTLKTVRQALEDGPTKKSDSYRKEFLLIENKDRPIGVAEIHINHPEPGTIYIGLLLLTEDIFGKGFGRRSYQLIEHYTKTIFEAKVMRLGVSNDHDISGYWAKMGFAPNGKTYVWKGENKTTKVVEFEKKLVIH